MPLSNLREKQEELLQDNAPDAFLDPVLLDLFEFDELVEAGSQVTDTDEETTNDVYSVAIASDGISYSGASVLQLFMGNKLGVTREELATQNGELLIYPNLMLKQAWELYKEVFFDINKESYFQLDLRGIFNANRKVAEFQEATVTVARLKHQLAGLQEEAEQRRDEIDQNIINACSIQNEELKQKINRLKVSADSNWIERKVKEKLGIKDTSADSDFSPIPLSYASLQRVLFIAIKSYLHRHTVGCGNTKEKHGSTGRKRAEKLLAKIISCESLVALEACLKKYFSKGYPCEFYSLSTFILQGLLKRGLLHQLLGLPAKQTIYEMNVPEGRKKIGERLAGLKPMFSRPTYAFFSNTEERVEFDVLDGLGDRLVEENREEREETAEEREKQEKIRNARETMNRREDSEQEIQLKLLNKVTLSDEKGLEINSQPCFRCGLSNKPLDFTSPENNVVTPSGHT